MCAANRGHTDSVWLMLQKGASVSFAGQVNPLVIGGVDSMDNETCGVPVVKCNALRIALGDGLSDGYCSDLRLLMRLSPASNL